MAERSAASSSTGTTDDVRDPRPTSEQLRDAQLTHLRDTLTRAYDNVAHYRHAFDAGQVTPRDLVTLEDLARFPSPRRTTYGRTTPSGCSPSRVHASSGTTGKPTVVGYTRDDLDTWSDVMS
ncbi:MAG TPA: hypothetical protein VFD59_12145 [Nocardioidaceae bacterium]|nr:hypothetical protein [Nocardioidaceae bacterium]